MQAAAFQANFGANIAADSSLQEVYGLYAILFCAVHSYTDGGKHLLY